MADIFRRRSLLGLGSGEISDNHYILSSGSQYINTETVMSVDDEMICVFTDIEPKTSSKDTVLFGSNSGGSKRTWTGFYRYGYSARFADIGFSSGSGVTILNGGSAETRGNGEKVTLSFLNDTSGRKRLTIVGEENGEVVNALSQSNPQSTNMNNSPVFLFCSSNNGSPVYYSTTGIYSFVIRDAAGNERLHLKAAMDNNMVPCMRDLVSGQYFYNRGSGSFVYV